MVMKKMSLVSCLLLAPTITAATRFKDPSTDHQTETYESSFDTVNVGGVVDMYAYFGPEHSSDTQVDMINEATSQIDVTTSSSSSWLEQCQPQINDDIGDDSASCAYGCSPTEQRNESFPLFPALLNALHRGVNVRILTNDVNTPDCPGTITMMQFLALNGADVRYFTTTTYIHAKIMITDNATKASVSSIYWSKESFTLNREAGIILRASTVNTSIPTTTPSATTAASWQTNTATISSASESPGSQMLTQLQQVFEFDFNQAYPLQVSSHWSEEDLAIIQDPSDLPIVLPNEEIDAYLNSAGLYISPAPPSSFTDSQPETSSSVSVGPDVAWHGLQESLLSAQSKLQASVYQVTTSELCSQLYDMYASGIDVQLLVGSKVSDQHDCRRAQACYAYLYEKGFEKVRLSSLNYTHSHMKYWIVDSKHVGCATGNWSPEDFPPPKADGVDDNDSLGSYPPFGEPGWEDVNRDFTIYTEDNVVVSSFETTFDNDYNVPETSFWTPENMIKCS